MAQQSVGTNPVFLRFGDDRQAEHKHGETIYWRDAREGPSNTFSGTAAELATLADGTIASGSVAILPPIVQMVVAGNSTTKKATCEVGPVVGVESDTVDRDSAPTSSTTGYPQGQVVSVDGTYYRQTGSDPSSPDWREVVLASADGLLSDYMQGVSGLSRVYQLPEASYTDGGVSAVPGVMRTQEIAVAEPLTITAASDDGPVGGNALSMITEYDGTLYAVEDTAKRLVKSADGGSTWVTTGLTTDEITRVWADPSTGNLLASDDNQVLKLSTDGGATFADVIHDASGETAPKWSTADVDTWAEFNSPLRAGNYLFVAEYGSSTGGTTETEIGNIVWRSADDGATWEAVFDQRDEDWCSFRHIHHIWHHAATGTVGFFTGDSYNRIVIVSRDYGETWEALTTRYDTWIQPVTSLDVGDPTRILCGADGTAQICVLDVLTGDHHSVYQGHSREDVQTQYTFGMHESSAGTIYAFQWTTYSDSPDSRPSIVAASSMDGPWAVVADFATTEGGIQSSAEVDGTLFAILKAQDGSYTRLSWPDVSVSTRQGVLLDHGPANLLGADISNGTEDRLEGSIEYGWVPNSNTNPMTIQGGIDAPGLPGVKCFAFTNAGGTAWAAADSDARVIQNEGRATGLSASTDYQVSFLARADGPISLRARTLKDSAATVGSEVSSWLDENWRRIELPVTTTAAADETERRVMIYVPDGPVSRTIYVTHLQCTEGIAPTWSLGGAGARAHAIYEADVRMPTNGWTHAMAVTPLVSGHAVRGLSTGEKYYLGRYYGSDETNDYAELYWEPSSADSGDLILAATTDGGGNTYTCQTTIPYEAHYGGGVIVVVKYDGDTNKFTLSVSLPDTSGNDWDSSTAATATAGFAGVTGRIENGGDVSLPGWYADLGFAGGVIPDASLWDWITGQSHNRSVT